MCNKGHTWHLANKRVNHNWRLLFSEVTCGPARTVSLRLTSCRIELSQSLLTNRFAACCLLHLSPTHESKLSTLFLNEEGPTLCVEPLWSRQESNLDLKFRKLLFYPLNYGTIPKRVAKIIDNPVLPQNACGLAAFNKTMYLSGSN